MNAKKEQHNIIQAPITLFTARNSMIRKMISYNILQRSFYEP